MICSFRTFFFFSLYFYFISSYVTQLKMIFKRISCCRNSRNFSINRFRFCFSSSSSLSHIRDEDPEASKLKDIEYFKSQLPKINDKQWGQIQHYNELIQGWNKKINLVSRNDTNNILLNHIIPSLSFSNIQSFRDIHCGINLIDVGSGGGFPGIPIAIAFPNIQVTLLDSIRKKTDVLLDFKKSLQLDNVQVVNERAERFSANPLFDIVVGRSVSSFPKFLAWTKNLRADQSTWKDKGIYYIKGGDFKLELNNLGIQNFKEIPISHLIPDFETDKKIVFIPYKAIPPQT